MHPATPGCDHRPEQGGQTLGSRTEGVTQGIAPGPVCFSPAFDESFTTGSFATASVNALSEA
jgi:hypothetical protein